MGLESIVSVTVDLQTRGVTRKSFGIPCVIGRHDAYPELAREYNLATALDDMVEDGFFPDQPIYRVVRDLASPTNKPEKVIIGKLTTAFTQKFEITCINATPDEDRVYSFILWAPPDVSTPATPLASVGTPISYTVLSGDTGTDVAIALSTAVDAIVDISEDGTPATAVAAFTADNPDEMWYVTGIDERYLRFKDTSVDSSLVSDLTAIREVNNSWYGLNLADPNSTARVLALAADTETREQIFGYTTHDGDVGIDTSGEALIDQDVMSQLYAAGYNRTFGLYSGNQGRYAASNWMSTMFVTDPGSATWCYKTLPGITVDDLTASFIGYVDGKNGNWYETIAGLNVTQTGKMASTEWLDNIRGLDWLVARLRERVFELKANAPKIPFTDPGILMIVSAVDAQLQEGISKGYIAADPQPFVTAPQASAVSTANKTERTLPDVYFEGVLQGAIHKTIINGVLSS